MPNVNTLTGEEFEGKGLILSTTEGPCVVPFEESPVSSKRDPRVGKLQNEVQELRSIVEASEAGWAALAARVDALDAPATSAKAPGK